MENLIRESCNESGYHILINYLICSERIIMWFSQQTILDYLF